MSYSVHTWSIVYNKKKINELSIQPIYFFRKNPLIISSSLIAY